jgi:hypothetical protein
MSIRKSISSNRSSLSVFDRSARKPALKTQTALVKVVLPRNVREIPGAEKLSSSLKRLVTDPVGGVGRHFSQKCRHRRGGLEGVLEPVVQHAMGRHQFDATR